MTNNDVKATMKAFFSAHETCSEHLPARWSRQDGQVRLTIECPCGASHEARYSGDVKVMLGDGTYVPIERANENVVIHGLTA